MAKKNLSTQSKENYEPLIQEVRTYYRIMEKLHDWVTSNAYQLSYRGSEVNLEFALIKLTEVGCSIRTYRRKVTYKYFTDKEDYLQQDKQTIAKLIDDTCHYLDRTYKAINDYKLRIITEKLNRIKTKVLNFEEEFL